MTKIGIIAEADSDIETLWAFIHRITKAKFKKLKFAANGCGKLKQKCQNRAEVWMAENVTHIIICHDLDGSSKAKYNRLRKELKSKISSLPNHDKVICIVIPIQEMEAWFLSDVDALNKKFPGLNLKDIPNPEQISSPKEFIQNKSKKKAKPRYIHTKDNPKLANIVDIDKIKAKCPEFQKFHNFITQIK